MGQAILNNDLKITGSANIDSNAVIAGTLNVTGASTFGNDVNMTGKKITSLANPTNTTDAATKSYVDAARSGLAVKAPVRVATTAEITLSGVQTIDDVLLVPGNRVLVKDQGSALTNGIYDVVSGAAWTRSADADVSSKVVAGMFCLVEEGTINKDKGFVLTTDNPIVLNTTGLTFAQFSGAGDIVAGNGLTKSGNTINVVGTSNRISVAADSIDISAAYAGQNTITTLGTIGTGIWQGNTITGTYGGTGVNNGTKTITIGGNFTHTGAHTLAVTTSANTSLILPITGTLATLAGSEVFSNKSFSDSVSIGGNLTVGGLFRLGDLITNITTNTSLSDADNGKIFHVSGDRTLTLPAWTGLTPGWTVGIVNINGDTVTVNPSGADQINDETTVVNTIIYTAFYIYRSNTTGKFIAIGTLY
jgi:hypothetical protein